MSHLPCELDRLEPRLLLSAVSFAPQVDYPTGSYSCGVVNGDFDKDGKPDLAVVNGDSATLSVLLNSGDGTFAPKTDYATGSVFDSEGHTGPYGLAAGDLNGDGYLDLVTANGPVDTVSVLINNGNGNFASHVDYPTGGEAEDVIVGDFNADGSLDLTVTNGDTNSLSVLLGNGNGTFGLPVDYATGDVPWRLASGDFNGDGYPDIAVANSGYLTMSGDSVSVLLNNGDGTFAAKADYTTGTVPLGVTVGDFNGDGRPDLAVANYSGNSVSVLLGVGDGTFSAKNDYAPGTGPHDLTRGDFNNDGKQDLAVANMDSNNISVLLGNGDGTFAAKTDFASGGHPASITAGDFNNDGKLDLASGSGNDDSVNVFLNQSPANAGWVAEAPVGTARDQFAAGVVDGKIYIFGGNAYPGGYNLKSTEVFDPSTNTWSYGADNENNGGEGVEELTGASVNGKFYVFGAYGGIGPGGFYGNINFSEMYDPAIDQWTSLAPKPTPVSGAPSVVYNGEIYIFGGGFTWEDAEGEYHDINYEVVEAYNPGTDSWRTVTNMPSQLFGEAVAVVGDKAYVIGGYDFVSEKTVASVEVLDFQTGLWTTSGLTPMPIARATGYAAAAPVVDGKIYVVDGGTGTFGSTGSPDSFWYLDRVDVYDPATNTWNSGPSLPAPREGSSGIVAVGNTIYVISGDDPDHSCDDDPNYASPDVWSWQVPANPAPILSDITKSFTSPGSLAFAEADFAGAFSDPATGGTLQDVMITALPKHGTLALDGVAVTQGQVVAAGDLGTLTYTPASSYAGIDSFGWNGTDGSQYATDDASVNLTVINVAWSTYFGGTGNEEVEGFAIDANGNKLIGGWTESSDLPSATNLYPVGVGVEGYIAKFDSSNTLLWSTYIGGSDYDTQVASVAVDSAGNAFVSGVTEADDLAGAKNALHNPLGGGDDAFLAKVSPSGTVLWSLYLGGSGDDGRDSQGHNDCVYVAADDSGNAYVTGTTQSSDFAGATGSYSGGTDSFVAKVSSDGLLQWATYSGGSGDDQTGGIAVNSAGQVVIAGVTSSAGLAAATNAYHGGTSDAFVAKFNESGSVQWVTYLGGSGDEGGDLGSLSAKVALDSDGTVVVTGYTYSTDFAGALNTYSGHVDGFVSKIDASGNILWSVYLSGSGIGLTAGVDVAIDKMHNILVVGLTGFTTMDDLSTMDGLVAKISPAGVLDWMTNVGGSAGDYTHSIVLDSMGHPWIAGGTWSSDFPAADNTAPGGDPSHTDEPYDGYLAELNTSNFVAGLHVFYNDSAFDGNDPAANANDDNAIDTGKQALLPGELAGVANYTSYSRGINGIMTDIDGQAGTPVANDFAFKVGNSNDLSTWVAAPAPTSITVRPGAGEGGSGRVTIIWADGAIRQTWLQVTVLSDAHGGSLGLANDDVFCFGNLPGDANRDGVVGAADYIALKRAFGSGVGSPGESADFDCSGTVDYGDLVALQGSIGESINMAFSAPAQAPAAIPAIATMTAGTPDIVTESAGAVAVPEPSASLAVEEAAAAATMAGLPPRLPATSSTRQATAEVLDALAYSVTPRLATTPSRSPLLTNDRADQGAADVLTLTRPWRLNESAKYELPDEPWMIRPTVDIAGKPRTGRLDPIGLDVLSVAR